MKVAFVADVHVGNHRIKGGEYQAGMNARCRQVTDILDAAVRCAVDHYGCEAVVSLGDLFDTEKPTPQMIRTVQDTFKHVNGLFLLGNHERVSALNGDHSLGPLYVDGSIVYETPDMFHGLVMVPFREGPAHEWIEEAIDDALSSVVSGYPTEALCVHLGLRDPDNCDPWAAQADDAVDVDFLAQLCKDRDIPAVFAGNWHTWQRWEIGGVTLTQVGALVPTGWDNPGIDGYGSVALLDCAVPRFVMDGPRFIKVSSAEEAREQLDYCHARSRAKVLNIRWECAPEDYLAARGAAAELRDHPGCLSFDVTPNKQEAATAARAAAVSARSASTLTDQLTVYFRKVQMSVNKKRVETRVRGYLGV